MPSSRVIPGNSRNAEFRFHHLVSALHSLLRIAGGTFLRLEARACTCLKGPFLLLMMIGAFGATSQTSSPLAGMSWNVWSPENRRWLDWPPATCRRFWFSTLSCLD